MQITEKLKLKKPGLTDYVNVGDLNENMDILDGEVGNLKEGSTAIENLQTENKTLAGAINELTNKKVDKVTGKGLSTNDYTNEEKLKNQTNAENIAAVQKEVTEHKADYRIHPLFVDYTLTNENVAFLSSCSVITLDVQLKELKDGMRFRFKTKRRIGCSYSAGAILIGIPGFTWKLSDSDLNEKGAFLASSSGAIVNELQDGLIYTIRLCMTDTNRGNFFILEDSRDFGTESSNLLSLDNITTPNNKQINVSYKSTAHGNRCQTNASDRSTASGTNSQTNASDRSTASGTNSQANTSVCSTASGNKSQVNASFESTASGNMSQVNVSSYSSAITYRTQVNASDHCTVDKSNSQINSSVISSIDGSTFSFYGGNTIISARGVKLDNSCGAGVVAGGSCTDSTCSTQNRKWQLDGDGNIKASGAITGNSSFADFAEYFESIDGESIPLGTIVSLAEGGKIKVAQEGDHMIGVISQTAGVILNAQGFEWKDRYLYDRYGQPILIDKEIEDESKIHEMYNSYLKTTEQQEEQKEHISLEEYKATLPDIPMTTIKAPMLNPNWDNKQEYIPREDRKEWNVVGLTGQIYTNIDNTVQEGDFVKVGQNGIATKGRNEYGQNWQVMKITTPYQEDLGFGIAIVFVR